MTSTIVFNDPCACLYELEPDDFLHKYFTFMFSLKTKDLNILLKYNHLAGRQNLIKRDKICVLTRCITSGQLREDILDAFCFRHTIMNKYKGKFISLGDLFKEFDQYESLLLERFPPEAPLNFNKE